MVSLQEGLTFSNFNPVFLKNVNNPLYTLFLWTVTINDTLLEFANVEAGNYGLFSKL